MLYGLSSTIYLRIYLFIIQLCCRQYLAAPYYHKVFTVLPIVNQHIYVCTLPTHSKLDTVFNLVIKLTLKYCDVSKIQIICTIPVVL